MFITTCACFLYMNSHDLMFLFYVNFKLVLYMAIAMVSYKFSNLPYFCVNVIVTVTHVVSVHPRFEQFLK